MKTLEVRDVGTRNLIGTIWQDEPDTMRADPPQLIQLADRFLESAGSIGDVMDALDGWSNGYITVRATG